MSVIAKRGTLGTARPWACAVKNMYVVVSLPKSKTRCQLRTVRTFTQHEMVIAVVAPSVVKLAGSVTKPPTVPLVLMRLSAPVPT